MSLIQPDIQLIGLGALFSCDAHQQMDSKATSLVYGLYDAFSRVTWSIALCYIFACVHGYGGPVNWFLAHPLWQPISRLSYSIYLLHFMVIMVLMLPMEAPGYFTELSAVSYGFCKTFILNLVFLDQKS